MPFTDSDIVTASLALRGVWIHDPLDVETSLASFPYGSAQRDTTVDAMGEGSFFAGRADPVFDYGEHLTRTVGCTIDVPHGPTYRDDLARLEEFAESKRSLWFRDNRGRSLLGTMSGFKSTDQPWGSVVSFTITKAHRDVTLTTSTAELPEDSGEVSG